MYMNGFHHIHIHMSGLYHIHVHGHHIIHIIGYPAARAIEARTLQHARSGGWLTSTGES